MFAVNHHTVHVTVLAGSPDAWPPHFRPLNYEAVTLCASLGFEQVHHVSVLYIP
jgi:hypothetical protein